MDSSEVITIEDTPPGSPVISYKYPHITIILNSHTPIISSNTHFSKNNMNLLSKEIDNKTSDSVINLTVEEEKDSTIDPNLKKDLQSRGVVIQSKNSLNQSEILKNSSKNINTQQFANNLFGFHSNFETPVYFPSYESYTLSQAQKIPSYCDNFSNVKCDEKKFLPESFMNPSVNERSSMQYMPEFIDINNFINYGSFGGSHFMSSENVLNKNIYQKVNVDLNSSKRNENNITSISFRRNFNSPSNSSKVIDLSSDDPNDEMEITNTNNKIDTVDDDLEIVYVGAYAREAKYQTLLHTVYKLPTIDEEKENSLSEINRQSPISISESISDNHTSQGSSDYKNKGKRKRKPALTVPRRNPKRQVQIEKDYLKLLDRAIFESKKDAKPKKAKKTNGSSNQNKKSTTKKTRQPLNVGAVYRPPSPLSLHHLREWPQTGMHERPEYNPVTNKLEPFDITIRNISVNSSNSSKVNNDPECYNEKTELKWLCHEMLHHVLAYSATVKSFINNEKEEEKMSFMKDLSLTDTLTTPLNLTKNNKFFLYSTETKEEIEKIEESLEELIGNSLLFYSLTNEVSNDNLSKYIQSINPEEVIDWSYKQFDLVD